MVDILRQHFGIQMNLMAHSLIFDQKLYKLLLTKNLLFLTKADLGNI